MKKILFILMLVMGSSYAKPCMTDIYFGNGVWNSERDAIYSKKALRNFMLFGANIRLDIQKEGLTYNFKHAYNPSVGTTEDLIETFWQLKESGQISYGYFMAVYTALTLEGSGELYNKLDEIIREYREDASTMFSQYNDESFKKKHNILLVAHSQGNLFGNKMYTLMSDAQKKKFRMVSVATPADHVAGGGSYVTAYLDPVIAGIPNHLSANVDGIGHTFIGTYCASFEARTKIALYVKTAYDNLIQTTSCSEYRFTKVTMPSFGILKVEGQLTNAYIDEEIGTIELPQTDAHWSNVKNKYVCGSNDSIYVDGSAWLGKEYWTFANGIHNRWTPGTGIANKYMLDSRSTITDDVRFGQKCVTISLEEGGELYDLIEANVAP